MLENISKSKRIFFYFYYFLSVLSFLALVFVFRPLRIKIFFTVLSVIIGSYAFFKKKESLFNFKATKGERAVSLCLESLVFFDFYFNAVHLRPQILTLIKISYLKKLFAINSFFAIIGIIVCLVGYYFVKTISPYMLTGVANLLKILKVYRFHFFALLAINTVSIVSIVRANYYYIDDLGRTTYGYDLTSNFSRYTSSFLSEIVHGNYWLADISPLTQIIASVIVSVTGIVILSVLADVIGSKPTKWSIIGLMPIGLSPYFLSCLSYKYDSPYMALSVFASVIPLIFYKKSTTAYSISVFLGTLVMCTTYQVSSGIFPMIVLIMALLMWIKKANYKTIFKFLLVSGMSYLLALVVFKLTIMTPIINDYVDAGIRVGNLLPNIQRFITYLKNDMPTIWKMLFFAIFVSYILMIIKNSKQNKLLSFFVSIIVSIGTFILSFGVYLVFNNPLIDPRAFYGVGIFISILSSALFLTEGFSIGKLSIVCLSWLFVVYAFIYGNALCIQKEYINFRTEKLISDCDSIGILKENEEIKVQAIGTAGLQRSVKNMIQQYPILKRQIPNLLSNSEFFWGTYQFREFYGLNIKNTNEINISELTDNNILKDTYYHTIYKVNDVVVVKLKDVENTVVQ